MRITVNYLMSFSQITGRKIEQVDLDDNATINRLLEVLIIKHGRELKKALEKDIDHRSVLFMVNGTAGELETVLHEGDTVLISYPVGGG